MKHKPKNKMQYDKHIKSFINKGYRLKSILMTRRILCTGYYVLKKNKKYDINKPCGYCGRMENERRYCNDYDCIIYGMVY